MNAALDPTELAMRSLGEYLEIDDSGGPQAVFARAGFIAGFEAGQTGPVERQLITVVGEHLELPVSSLNRVVLAR